MVWKVVKVTWLKSKLYKHFAVWVMLGSPTKPRSNEANPNQGHTWWSWSIDHARRYIPTRTITRTPEETTNFCHTVWFNLWSLVDGQNPATTPDASQTDPLSSIIWRPVATLHYNIFTFTSSSRIKFSVRAVLCGFIHNVHVGPENEWFSNLWSE